MNYAVEIKRAVTAREVAEAYGYHTNRAGFICCPFHGEKTASMKLYSGDRGWCCFGCGKHGSVIDFVMQHDGLTFAQAETKLNEMFQIGLPIDEKPTLRQRRMFSERQKLRESLQKDYDDAERAYWTVFKMWATAHKNKIRLVPASPDEPPCAMFMEALQTESYLEYLMDFLQENKNNAEERLHSGVKQFDSGNNNA